MTETPARTLTEAMGMDDAEIAQLRRQVDRLANLGWRDETGRLHGLQPHLHTRTDEQLDGAVIVRTDGQPAAALLSPPQDRLADLDFVSRVDQRETVGPVVQHQHAGERAL